MRRVFWRILFFYVLGSLAIGVLVSSDDPHLLKAQADEAPGAARSPWVIGIQNAGIEVLPSIINAVILTSATSSANAFLYTGSRYLYALAQNGQAPQIFLKCSKAGVPYYAVLLTATVGLLTYLSAGSGGAAKAFGWFQNLTTIAGLFTWCSICTAYISFHRALKAQGVNRDTLIFKSPFQPYTAWISLFYFAAIIFFSGFSVFLYDNWDVSGTFSPLPRLLRPPALSRRSLPLTSAPQQPSSPPTSASPSTLPCSSSGRSSSGQSGSRPWSRTCSRARPRWTPRTSTGPSSTPETCGRRSGSGSHNRAGQLCCCLFVLSYLHLFFCILFSCSSGRVEGVGCASEPVFRLPLSPSPLVASSSPRVVNRRPRTYLHSTSSTPTLALSLGAVSRSASKTRARETTNAKNE